MTDPDATTPYRPTDLPTSDGPADLTTCPFLDSPTADSPPQGRPTVAGEQRLCPNVPEDAPPGFVIERRIGIGGMGVVYLARQAGLNRPVALKMVKSDERVDPRALIRFLAEAEAVAAVKHPNVVEVHQYGEHHGKPFMALEYCSGGDLTSLSKADKVRDTDWFRRAAGVMAQVADGVNAAHALGIVHRDLKPANVFLAADGTPKVADFGLAKRGLGTDLTHTTDVLGTPAYMSPEQAGGGTKFVGPEADVWALGVMLYELCCGERPIDTRGPLLDAVARVARGEVPALRTKALAVPPDLALIAHKCLSADPRDRYPTAGLVATDLRHWLDGKPISVRPAGPAERLFKWARRNKTLAGMATLVFLTMAVATGVSFGFGLEANGQRNNAVSAAGQATAEKEAAVAARNDVAVERDRANRALARSLLAQMADRGGAQFGFTDTMSEYEWEAIWELAEQRGLPVGLVFLEEATSTPLNVVRFQNRAKYLIHAAVGLDSRQRNAVDALVTRRLRDPVLPLVTRQQVARAAVAGEVVGGSAGDIADELVPEVERGGDGLSVLAAIGPSVPTDRVDRVLAALLSAMGKVPPNVQADLADPISRIWLRLPAEKVGGQPEEARRQLADRIRLSNPSTRDPQYLSYALAGLSRYSGGAKDDVQLSATVGELHAALGKGKDDFQRDILVTSLCTVISCLPSDAAEKEFEKLTDWLLAKWETEPVADERWRWPRLLSKLGGRGGSSQAVERLLNGLKQGPLTPESANLILPLAVIAERLPQEERHRAARQAAKALTAPPDEELANDQGIAKVTLLTAVAQLLPPASATALPTARNTSISAPRSSPAAAPRSGVFVSSVLSCANCSAKWVAAMAEAVSSSRVARCSERYSGVSRSWVRN